MLWRTIGGHYGQVPKVAEMALNEVTEAWTLPMGSISRMVRAQSTHSPGHITSVGIGTYVDPEISGGAANEKATKSTLHDKLVRRITIDDQLNLMYKALPIDVAIIRGTTADAQGNITAEEESLLCDQKIIAAAAKNSGGIVIAQVKRLAAAGSLPCRQVAVPGPLVDCVVVVDEKDHDSLHGMSFEERHNPALTGELVTPRDEIKPMELGIRKVIARRAFFGLKPDKIVNLGIGMPEGVASVAAEEGMLDYVTLSTEPGVFGGLPASGRNFGPAFNASALVEMNQMFDFYDGGGLNMCFLGAAQISPNGDVNVSRMAKNRLTGPGGFIDISQSTRNICFMTPLTVKGLEISCPGDGSLKIDQEGSVKKFVSEVFEKTFSGDEAVRRGQQVFYVTERAVFRRTGKHDVIELIEVAKGVDVQKDVIDQMDFTPAISPNLKTMDPRIFMEAKMNVTAELFGSLEERCKYHEKDHTLFLDLFGITLNTHEDIEWFFSSLAQILDPLVKAKGEGVHMVIQYDGFDLRNGLEDEYSAKTHELEKAYYGSVKRFTGSQFRRAQLGKNLRMSEWDPDRLWEEFDVNHDGTLTLEELRYGIKDKFAIQLSPSQLGMFQKTPESTSVDKKTFAKAVEDFLKMTN
jgi:propionate CoA-transferase